MRILGSFFLLTFSLSAQPVVFDGGVLNAASFAKNAQGQGLPVTAGSLVSIFGTGLATQLASFDSVPFSTSLGGVSVTFNNVATPMRDVVPNAGQGFDQINVQLPWNIFPAGQTSGVVNVVVTRGGVSSAPKPVEIAQFSPGVYSIPDGVGYAKAFNPDNTIAAPGSTYFTLAARPARRGETIFFYASGLGALDDTPANGADSLDKLRNALVKPQVLFGGITADALYAVLAPQFPGVYQVGVTVPQNAPTGDKIAFQLSVGGQTSTDQVTIAIQ